MHSITNWKFAESPNYNTNVDKVYPYSETPFLGEYRLVQLPLSLNEPVAHVDYWGEGLVRTQHGVSGFDNCYNVNHPYQLVSNGPDRDRKIPNRVPVRNHTDCDTSAYIRDNSVVLVTVMGAPINSSCAADIARIVNNDLGKVIVFGFDKDSQYIANLTAELRQKSLYYCPNYKRPKALEGVTLFDNHMAFLNVTELKDILYKLVCDAKYDDAVSIAQNFDENDGEAMSEVVQKLLNGNSTINARLMAFAYKLWNGDAKNVVRTFFPKAYKLMLGQEDVTIVNKGYGQALKLDANTDRDGDRIAWGDSSDKTSKRVKWHFVPVWSNNEVTFKVYNVDCGMYLKLAVGADDIGDRQVFGSTDSNTNRHRYFVEPCVKNGSLLFYIISYEYRQGLKMAVATDSMGDRLLFGHNGNIYDGEARFKWVISSWP